MMTIKVLESVSGIFLAQVDVPIRMWHMIKITNIGFSEHHQMQVPITENQVGLMGMMSQTAEQVEMDYPEAPDSK